MSTISNPRLHLAVPDSFEILCDQKYFDEILSFAIRIKQTESLQRCFDSLHRIARNTSSGVVRLYSDFADHSLYFEVCDSYLNKCKLNGGLIYHGSVERTRDNLSVTLTATDGWQIHT